MGWGRVRLDWRWLAKRGQGAGVQNLLAGPGLSVMFHYPGPREGPCWPPCHKSSLFFPALDVGWKVGGGEGDPMRRAGPPLLLPPAGPRPAALKVSLMTRNEGAHCPGGPLVPARLPAPPPPFPSTRATPTPRPEQAQLRALPGRPQAAAGQVTLAPALCLGRTGN